MDSLLVYYRMKNATTLSLLSAIALCAVAPAQQNALPASGNVGIGTPAPEVPVHLFAGDSGGTQHAFSRLTVEDDYHASVTIMTPSARIGNFAFADESSPFAGGMTYDHSDDRLIFTVSDTNYALQINKFGQVGIGGPATSAALEVNGTVALSDGGGFALRKASGKGAYAIHYAAVAPRYPLRFVGSSDAGTHRYFEFGYYDGDNAANAWHSKIAINSYTGFVGVGTMSPTHPLSVNGAIRAKEVIVESGWSDFVFESDYRLRPLSEVESHIAERGHLPDVPSAADVEGEGLSIGATQRIMMQKIEELTLYAIEQNKRIEAQQAEIDALKARSKL